MGVSLKSLRQYNTIQYKDGHCVYRLSGVESAPGDPKRPGGGGGGGGGGVMEIKVPVTPNGLDLGCSKFASSRPTACDRII